MPRDSKYENIKGGIQISGATHASEGTLGYVVRNDTTMRGAILTNRHVISDDDAAAQINQNVDLIIQRAARGKAPPCSEAAFKQLVDGFAGGQGQVRPVFQPAYMGGTNPAARIVAFAKKMSGVSDAALCDVAEGFTNYHCQVVASPDFIIPGQAQPQEGMKVMKSGAKTGMTYGRIKQIEGAVVLIEPLPLAERQQAASWPAQVYDAGAAASDVLSAQGDSGSIWVSAQPDYHPRYAVALLYKGLPSMSIARDINEFSAKLGFSFVSLTDILD